jgi:hypothetical protein
LFTGRNQALRKILELDEVKGKEKIKAKGKGKAKE